MGKPKVLELTEAQRLELERGFRLGEKHCFRMRCRAVLLKVVGLSSAKAGAQTDMSFVSVNAWVKRYMVEGINGLITRSGHTFWSWPEAYHGQFGRRICSPCHRAGQAMREQGQGSLGTGNRQRGERCDLQTFFISIGGHWKWTAYNYVRHVA